MCLRTPRGSHNQLLEHSLVGQSASQDASPLLERGRACAGSSREIGSGQKRIGSPAKRPGSS
eukprot:7578372-Pyramimonas_sp.AAC.1